MAVVHTAAITAQASGVLAGALAVLVTAAVSYLVNRDIRRSLEDKQPPATVDPWVGDRQANVTVELLVGPFYSAVRQAQIVTNDDSRGVDFTFADGTLTLESQATDVGTSKIELPIAYDGEKLTIKFDPRFIAEFLRVLEPEQTVTLRLIDSERAAVFETDDQYTYVVMPLSREP